MDSSSNHLYPWTWQGNWFNLRVEGQENGPFVHDDFMPVMSAHAQPYSAGMSSQLIGGMCHGYEEQVIQNYDYVYQQPAYFQETMPQHSVPSSPLTHVQACTNGAERLTSSHHDKATSREENNGHHLYTPNIAGSSSNPRQIPQSPPNSGGDPQGKPKRPATFVCTLDCCGARFTTKYRLGTHINNYHTDPKDQERHDCERCDYSTVYASDLTRHQRSCRP